MTTSPFFSLKKKSTPQKSILRITYIHGLKIKLKLVFEKEKVLMKSFYQTEATI